MRRPRRLRAVSAAGTPARSAQSQGGEMRNLGRRRPLRRRPAVELRSFGGVPDPETCRSPREGRGISFRTWHVSTAFAERWPFLAGRFLGDGQLRAAALRARSEESRVGKERRFRGVPDAYTAA